MTRTLIPLIYYAIIYARVCKGYECIEKLLFKYEIKLLYKTFLCDSSKQELFWERCSPRMFLLSIYIRPLPGQKVLSFSWIFFNTSYDTLVVKTKPDINVFFTKNLWHLWTICLILLKSCSVFDWLLSFKALFIPAWRRTVSGVYIFKFTSNTFLNNYLELLVLIVIGKCCLIFWMHINFDRRPPFRNLFWILLRVPYCPLKICRQIPFFTVFNIITKIQSIVHKS